MTTKTKKIFSFTFIGIFAVILIAGTGLHYNIIKLPGVVLMSAQYPADFGDDRILVGGANNVFIGRVVEETGRKVIDQLPYTQFSVEIVDNIKGKLQGIIIVNQSGGYKNGTLYVETGDVGYAVPENSDLANNAKGYFLQPGSTYLFVTRGNSSVRYGFYWLGTYPTSLKLISSNEKLNTEQLRDLAKKDERVKALLSAYPNEILLDADIARLGTPNSFKSLPEEEQEKIKAEVEKMKITAVPVTTE